MIQINGGGRSSNDKTGAVAPAMAGALSGSLDLYMADRSNEIEKARNCAPTSREELLVFLIIVALVWPALTVGVVGGYGFTVWMYQLVAGPPGPPKR